MAVLDIVLNSEDGKPVSLGIISDRQGISIAYLEQLFLNLKRYGILKSTKGPGGGYSINKPLDKISLHDLLSSCGEKMKFTGCSVSHSAGCNKSVGKCVAHKTLENIESKIQIFLSSVSLQDLKDNPCYMDQIHIKK
jgi:Rrf2 family iron-sulfur cluster assembly transcriptional regulator